MQARARDKRLTFWRRVEPAEDTQASDPENDEVGELWASIVFAAGSEGEQGDRQNSYEKATINVRAEQAVLVCDSTWWATRTNPRTGVDERYEFTSVRTLEGDREIEIDAVRVE